MKNHQLPTTFLFIIFSATSIFAQKNYTGINGGYGISIASQTITSQDGSSQSEDEVVKGSFGKGANFGINLGYMLHPNVGAEIGVSYLYGGAIEAKDAGTSGYATYTNSLKISATMLRITPSIKVTSANAIINVYSKAGLIIGMLGKIQDEIINEYNYLHSAPNYQKEESTHEFEGGISTGFTGSLGMSFQTGSSSCFFAEVCCMSHAWAPEKRITTGYKVNGSDKYSTLTESEKEMDFVDKIDETTTTNQNQPTKELKVYLPMSALYFNVGFQFAFGQKKKAETKPATEVK